jgi:arylsulfatase A-like enzyme
MSRRIPDEPDHELEQQHGHDHARQPGSSGMPWDAEVAEAQAAIRADAAAHAAGGAGTLTRRSFLTSAAAAIPAAAIIGGGGGLAAAAGRSRSGSRSASRRRGAGPGAACALPADVLARCKRGWDPVRSGQIIVVPHGWNYMDGGISHSTPWHYTQDVPMLWYGPGFIRAVGARGSFVTSADIAPTMAKLMKYSFDAHDGSPMDEAIKPGAAKPKLIVVLVWDAGGRYVLNLHPGTWPNLKRLIGKGTWFSHATVGSNPSNTAPVHATIGTGSFPYHHGIVDNTIRFSDGHLDDPWARGPGVLKVPTLADEYAKAMGSKARTAAFGTLPWHLAMVGQGANLPGGVKHIAVLRDQGNADTEAPKWKLPDRLAPFYRFPAYVNQNLPPLSSYWKQYADGVDGRLDGTWRGHSIVAADGGFHTPARVPFQTKAIKKVIDVENLGKHQEPDLLFLNYKIIDEIGHEYYSDSPEMADTIRVQDEFLGHLVDYLDRWLPNQWVLCLTADHGHSSTPERTGGSPLSETAMHSLLNQRFDDSDDRALVQVVRPTTIQLNPDEVKQNQQKLDPVSSYIAGLTLSQIGKTYRPGTGSQRAFDAVFAGSLLKTLDC